MMNIIASGRKEKFTKYQSIFWLRFQDGIDLPGEEADTSGLVYRADNME